MTRGDTLRRVAVTSLAVVAGIGFSALKPRTAAAACNIPEQIANLENKVEGARTFRQPALQPEHPHGSDYVKVFSKKAANNPNEQFMIDPLVIQCGATIVRYVGLTNDRSGTLGQKLT